MEVIESDINVEMDWVVKTETQLDKLLLQGPPDLKGKQTELNVTIYDVSSVRCGCLDMERGLKPGCV